MKVETYTIQNWDIQETGLLIAENEDWILVKHIPADYLIDGYKLYAKKVVLERISDKEEKKIRKVLKLRNTKEKQPKGFPLTNAIEMLKWCEEKYGQFEFEDLDNDLFFGKMSKDYDDKFIIDFIDADGNIEKNYDCEFSINDISAITFGSDYFNAIQLLRESQLKK
jgi:hypothetical protein